MSRKRVIYQSEALFTTSTGRHDGVFTRPFLNPSADWDGTSDSNNHTTDCGNHWSSCNLGAGIAGRHFDTGVQIHRVTEANYGFEIARTDVNQFGQLAAIDRIILEQPTVNLDFTYYVMSGENERNMGFYTEGDASAITDFLKGEGDVRNYYIYIAREGDDAVDAGDHTRAIVAQRSKCIGLGNGTLTNYTVDAAVGEMPTASVTLECFNMRFYADVTGEKPSIKPEDGTNLGGDFQLLEPDSGTGFSCLRHGDIELTIDGTQGLLETDLKIQNFSLSLDLDREPIQKLGTKFNFSREIVFPVTPTLTCDAIMGDIAAANLADVIVGGQDDEFTLTMQLNSPDKGSAIGDTDADLDSSEVAMRYTLLGAKLDSQTFTSTIGDNKAVALAWSAQIGGSGDAVHNMRMKDGGAVNRA
tara:strand:+ start:2574 stop:3818 length:1245 start_codon:yes stop_codon:yes gene_type:complete